MSFFLTTVLAALDDGGDRVLFHQDGVTTYHQARDRLRRLHGGLGEVDVVAIDVRNRPETLLVQLAALLRGATVLLVAASAPRPDRLAAATAAGVTTVVTDRPDDWPGDDVRTLDDLDGAPRDLHLPSAVRVLFPTGGTTGTPKLIRHSGIYDGMAYIFAPSPDGPGRTLLVAPMTHMTGNATVFGALLRRDTLVLQDGFDAGAVVEAIQEHRIDTLSLTPPRLAAVLDHPALTSTDVSSVRSLSLGAAPLPPHRLAQALDVFGPVVGQGYGLTEAPMIASISAAELAGHPERLGSVGRIVPGMEARLADGEVEVRGLSMMDGYLGGPEVGAGFGCAPATSAASTTRATSTCSTAWTTSSWSASTARRCPRPSSSTRSRRTRRSARPPSSASTPWTARCCTPWSSRRDRSPSRNCRPTSEKPSARSTTSRRACLSPTRCRSPKSARSTNAPSLRS